MDRISKEEESKVKIILFIDRNVPEKKKIQLNESSEKGIIISIKFSDSTLTRLLITKNIDGMTRFIGMAFMNNKTVLHLFRKLLVY